MTPEYGQFKPNLVLRSIVSLTRTFSSSWLRKRCVFLVRKIAMGTASRTAFDLDTLGVKMRLHPFDNRHERALMFMPQMVDLRERDFILPFLSRPVVFVDVGANVGAYSLWVAVNSAPGSRIVAVEANGETFDRLCFNISINGFANVKAIRSAILDGPRFSKLFVNTSDICSTGVRLPNAGLDEVVQIETPAMTISDLSESEMIAAIDMLKVDVGGGEDIILAPFLETAGEDELPAVIIVRRPHVSESAVLNNALASRGYALTLATEGKWILVRAPAPMRN